MGKSRILQLMNNIALISFSTSQVFLFVCLLDFSLNLQISVLRQRTHGLMLMLSHVNSPHRKSMALVLQFYCCGKMVKPKQRIKKNSTYLGLQVLEGQSLRPPLQWTQWQADTVLEQQLRTCTLIIKHEEEKANWERHGFLRPQILPPVTSPPTKPCPLISLNSSISQLDTKHSNI